MATERPQGFIRYELAGAAEKPKPQPRPKPVTTMAVGEESGSSR